MHYVAVVHHVFLTFNPELPYLATGSLGAEGRKILVRDHLSLNKSFLKIGMNNTRGLRSFHAMSDGPSPYLFFTCGKIRIQFQELVCSFNKLVNSRFVETHVGKEHLLFFISF